MPLERVMVRNEYAVGAPKLYREVNQEDPGEILDGVAAAGLVGVLRQLGDLAEFAAEIFHGLQEALMTTSSRSCKLMSRVHGIEAALSPLQKAVLAQRTHLHFAYTTKNICTAMDWHVHIQCQQNHFVYSDMPQFIKDSYEDCGDPPNFYLLDRFDTGGPGSCLKRYSDPTFFKRASMASGEVKRASKSSRIKKRRSWHRNGELHRDASFLYNNGRKQLTQRNIGGHPSPAPTLISELEEQSKMELRKRSDCPDGDAHPSYSVQPEEQNSRKSFATAVNKHNSNFLEYNILDGEKIANAYYDIQINPSQEQTACNPSSVTVNGTGETLEHTAQKSDHYGMVPEDDSDNRPLETFSLDLNLHTVGDGAKDFQIVDQPCHQPVQGLESSGVPLDSIEFCNQVAQALGSSDVHLDGIGSCDQAVPTLESSDVHIDETVSSNQAVLAMESTNVHLDDIESETDHYVDALNYTIELEGESEVDCMRKEAIEHSSKIEDRGVYHVPCELTSHNMECRSSIITSFDFANRSPSNAGCEQSNCLRNGVAVKDEIHSASLVDNALRSSQMVGGSSLNLISLPSAESCGNGGINNRSAMADEAKSSMESHKNASDTSSTFTSATFWTNGGLLGLQPSKPPDCSASDGIPQDPVYDNDGKISLSSYQAEKFKNCHLSISGGRKDILGGEFPTILPPPSPPLEHMKVSFQPIDGFQTSKLKMKFPNGDTDCGSSSDIFPSFQLAPEAFVTWHYVGSDSDADTFYRSSPSDTDDPRSYQSESDSEHWEARQSPTTRDHELYNALGRISLTESCSTVPENGNSGSRQLSDLHSLGSISHASPVSEPQWGRTTPQPDGMENKSKPMRSYHAYNLIKHSTSSLSCPKPAPSNEDHADATNVPKSKSGLWMTNGQRKDDQGKSIIDENVFLRQIRTKSFNLRPTPAAKPTVVPLGSSVNAQVTAILVKANAIRQAVGSEEEDDGEWTD